jgi:prolyl-tRNA editing enzyme YbaK/EbsC (Cys-tRNA(Pro) deacylase)
VQFGSLTFAPALDSPWLLAPVTAAALKDGQQADVLVAEIDPELADTQAFCARYDISEHDGANCVIVEAKRGDRVWHAACLVLGDERLDVNAAASTLMPRRHRSRRWIPRSS